MKDYTVYKDLSLREASILRIYEMAVCLCDEYVKKVRSGEGTPRDLVHAAWIYRKYIYCLDRAYYFISQCAFLGSKGNLIPAGKAVIQMFFCQYKPQDYQKRVERRMGISAYG